MATAIELIRTNYDKALYITRLAKTFGIGPSSFHHHFKSATTMSPSTQNVDAPGLQTANIVKVPGSDRDTFEDLSQSPSFRSLSRLQVVDSKRRDVRVVEGARLESDVVEPHRDVPKHLFRSPFNDLALGRGLSVFPCK